MGLIFSAIAWPGLLSEKNKPTTNTSKTVRKNLLFVCIKYTLLSTIILTGTICKIEGSYLALPLSITKGTNLDEFCIILPVIRYRIVTKNVTMLSIFRKMVKARIGYRVITGKAL
jgi:hypothetical protein